VLAKWTDELPAKLQPTMPTEVCRCGHAYTAEGYTLLTKKCLVHRPPPCYTEQRSLYHLDCPLKQAGCRVLFDPEEYGLFRSSDECMVALETLYEFVDEFTERGVNHEAFVASKRKALERAPRRVKARGLQFCASNTFRKVYYAFAARLTRVYAFKCPKCGDNPEVLVCDATAETIQKGRYSGTPVNTIDESCCLGECHGRRKRGLFEHVRDREDIRALAGHMRGSASSDRKGEAAVPFDAATGPTRCREVFQHLEVAGFSDVCLGLLPELSAHERAAVGRFLGCMASESPVLSYCPLAIATRLYQELMHDQSLQVFSVELMFDMRREAPVLWEFLGAMFRHGRHLQYAGEGVRGGQAGTGPAQAGGHPEQARQAPLHMLLLRLAWVDIKLCAASPHGGTEQPPPHAMEEQPSSQSHSCLVTGVCCGLRRVRPRLRCKKDPVQKCEGAEEEGVYDIMCRHSFIAGSGASHRTGGIFTWFCQHGVCYGFYMLEGAEGRNDAYSFLVSYFSVAPKVVVYDFACSLQEYCLNRAPEFFKNTTFLVDRFHWFNHVGCASSYNLSLYTELEDLNSQVAEQCNSALSKIKPLVSQMSMAAFMFNVRLYLDVWNAKQIKKWEAIDWHLQPIDRNDNNEA
jgi:hypothetical protein